MERSLQWVTLGARPENWMSPNNNIRVVYMKQQRQHRSGKLWLIGLLLCFLLLTGQPAVAVAPIGGEIQVNAYTSTNQWRVSLAAGRQMTPFAVWQSTEQEGEPYGIYGRYLPSGPVIHLNDTPATQLNWPAVGSAWDFTETIVAWAGPDGNTPLSIYGRMTSPGILTREVQISEDLHYRKGNPAVAASWRGSRWVVVWHSIGQDGFWGGIYGRRLSSIAEPVGDEFQINTFTGGTELFPDVAMNYRGDFVVVWLSADGAGHEGIYGQRYDWEFNPVGDEMEIVNFGDTGDVAVPFHGPAVAMDPAGNFVVAWTKLTGDADIYARRYYANGEPAGPAFRVNSYTERGQRAVDVAMDQRGNFVVVWQSEGQDGSSTGVYGQLFDGFGTPVDEEFQVNEYTTGGQAEPSVDMADVGTWTVAWSSEGQDGDGYGIFARSYQHDFPAYTVTSTADPGDGVCTFDECTLREVLAEAAANASSGPIRFAIPGAGPHTIHLASPLVIKSGVTIDGYTQPGAQPNTNPFGQGLNAVLKIAIDGSIEVRSGVTFKGLAIDGGIDVYQTNATFYGNFIGTDVTGTTAVGSSGITLVSGGGGVRVGGGDPAQRNLIVGRVYAGTFGSLVVDNNLMGTDITGTRRIGGGTVVGMNTFVTVSNNVLTGVSLGEASASITGNYMGTDVTGTKALGGGSIYSGYGAGFSANNNLFAFNGGTPVVIGNSGRLSNNRIFSNGGLGIDVGNDGVSLNDPGDLNNAGRGGIQNFPIANLVYNANGQTVIEGILDSRANNSYSVEFFANSECDPSGFGEGEQILGRTVVTTDGNGKAVYQLEFPGETPVGHYITAISTGPNTSEFSPCRVAGAANLNGALTMNRVTTTYDPTAVKFAPAGVYTISATFTNHSAATLHDLYYRLTTLTENHVVLNASGGPVGYGGVVAVPDAIGPGMTFTVDFAIGLQAVRPFDFFVDAFGLAQGDISATAIDADGFAYAVPTDALQREGERANQIYLPLIAR